MSDLLTMLNHLLAAWMAQQEGAQGWEFSEARLDAQGGVVRGRVSGKGFEGEVVIRLVAEPPSGASQTLRLQVERWPETMPPPMENFRTLLEKARLKLELDFSP